MFVILHEKYVIGYFHGISTTIYTSVSKSHEIFRICRSCQHMIIHKISFSNFINKCVHMRVT
jgi:hypothetical protein